MTANWPIPETNVGSRRTAACVTLGAISLSNSGHFPHRLYSNCIKPVALPPGRDRLWTKPEPIGSGTTAKNDRNGASSFQHQLCTYASGQNYVRGKRYYFLRIFARFGFIARYPSEPRSERSVRLSNPIAQTLPKMPCSVPERRACLLVLAPG